MEVQGTTVFRGDKQGDKQNFRFAVSVKDEKLRIWLEDCKSKQQWRTNDLDLNDYVSDRSAIPQATPRVYAERFLECLKAEATESNLDSTRSLSEAAKDGSRTLTLVVQLSLSTFTVDLEYAFNLVPVALEQVDILAAEVRDLREELAALKQQEQKQPPTAAPTLRAVAEFTSLKKTSRAQIRWSPSKTTDTTLFVLDTLGNTIEVVKGGHYLIVASILHSSTNASAQVEVVVNGTTVRTFTDTNEDGHTRQATIVVPAQISNRGRVGVHYLGNSYAMPGSVLSLAQL